MGPDRLDQAFEIALEEKPHDAGTLSMWSDFKEERGEVEAANRLRVHALVGKNYLGPEAWALLGAPLTGEVAPLPRETLDPAFWGQPCPIVQDGRTIAETHRLAYIPENMTLLELRRLATEAQASLGRPRIVYREHWYEGIDFATKTYAELAAAAGLGTVENGRWALLPERELPGSRGKPYSAHEIEFARYPDYRTALCIELVTVLVLDDVQNLPTVNVEVNDRLLKQLWAWCADTVTENERRGRVLAGNFDALGLSLFCFDDDARDDYLGHAVLRKFSEATSIGR